MRELRLGDDGIAGTNIAFQQYKNVLPALVESSTRIRDGDGLSSPICGSITADDDGGFHGTVRVSLNRDYVYGNRARISGSAGDGVCGSDARVNRHELWTWQTSTDGLTWTNVDPARQPPGYDAPRSEGQCSFTYTPHADDRGKYIRAYVPVTTTGVGDNDYHTAAFGPLNLRP